MSETQDTFTTKQLAKRWQLNVETIRRRLRKGAIDSFKIGGYRRIPASEVHRIERGEKQTA